MSKPKHPMQPIITDERGVARFKKNKIVRALLDRCRESGMGLNEIAFMDFTDEDRCQFAQLIGYSVSGYGDLSYVNSDEASVADLMVEQPDLTEEQARIKYLEGELEALHEGLREPISRLFCIHPDDLAG